MIIQRAEIPNHADVKEFVSLEDVTKLTPVGPKMGFRFRSPQALLVFDVVGEG
jgi:hypothetical protein